MKMAKASMNDLETAMELCNALDGISSRWGATMPEKISQLDPGREVENFDPDNPDQCVRVIAYFLKLASRASLMRVVFGMTIMLDPRNKIVDPNSDVLERHPETVAALKAMENSK